MHLIQLTAPFNNHIEPEPPGHLQYELDQFLKHGNLRSQPKHDSSSKPIVTGVGHAGLGGWHAMNDFLERFQSKSVFALYIVHSKLY